MIETQYKYNHVKKLMARYLCGLEISNRLLTYEEFSSMLEVDRGTIQR